MIYTVHAGHAAQGNPYSGASGLCHESVENRKIKDAVIKYLKFAGHTVYDCTVDKGISQSDIITQIKKKINSHSNVMANISIHLNCYNGSAKGTECCVYSNTGTTKQIAEKICSNIASLGFVNRQVKTRTDLGVLKGITNGGVNILVETFFCDSQNDYDKYKGIGADMFGKIMAEAILGTVISQTLKDTSTDITNKKIEGRTTTMQCFYTVDGKGPVIYFDGKDFHPLAHQDEMTVLNQIYKDNNGKDMPSYNWSSSAPWHVRLKAAMERK